jgi:hypothetical protein
MIMLGLGPTTFVWNQQVGPSCVGLTNDGYQRCHVESDNMGIRGGECELGGVRFVRLGSQ